MRRMALVSLFALSGGTMWMSSAQPATCPDVVGQALVTVGDVCGAVGRNEACYGNLSLQATPRDSDLALAFDSPGDRVSIGNVEALSLADLDANVPEWGVAILSLQANIPSSLPGQVATIVLFGDVQIEDVGGPGPALPDVVAIGDSAPVHREPSVDAAVVGTIGREPQRVVGRLADGSWLRVALADGVDGWVFTPAIAIEGDALDLLVTAPDVAPPDGRYGSMQAFTLRTGIGAPSCVEAPHDGILIQTPDGARAVQFQINGIDIALGSTAAVRAVWGDSMRIALLEGNASFTVPGGGSGIIRPAEVGIFKLNAHGRATGEFIVAGYSDDDISALPIVLLPRAVQPRTPEQLAVARSADVPEGRWRLAVADAIGSCVRVNAHELDISIERIDDDTFVEHTPIQDTVFELQPDGSWVFSLTDNNRGRHITTTTIFFDGGSGEGQRVFRSIRPDLSTCEIVVGMTYEYLGE